MPGDNFSPQLAIVIPAYKAAHFRETLLSLVDQTSKAFTVYIGDDCGPDEIRQTVLAFGDKLPIHYTRFEENIGKKSLVQSWNRCLGLVKEEEWVCVLPDDDMLSPRAVEQFYHCLQENDERKINAVKLAVKVLERDGCITDLPVGEGLENNYQYYKSVVRGKGNSTLGDVIYRKEKLLAAGGFEEFPRGWGSDHCTLIKAASGGLICHLPDAHLVFRMSGANISSDTGDGAIKMRARYLFGKWMRSNAQVWDEQPDTSFYRYFYWKGEYYFLHVWRFSLPALWYLYKLHTIMNRSVSPIPVLKVSFRKLFRAIGFNSSNTEG